jgi:hypothetical protein
MSEGQRKSGPICLLPRREGIPLLHHSHFEFCLGEMIHHQKELAHDLIDRHPKYIEYYNISNKVWIFKNRTIIERRGFWNETYGKTNHIPFHQYNDSATILGDLYYIENHEKILIKSKDLMKIISYYQIRAEEIIRVNRVIVDRIPTSNRTIVIP